MYAVVFDVTVVNHVENLEDFFTQNVERNSEVWFKFDYFEIFLSDVRNDRYSLQIFIAIDLLPH